MIFITLGTHEQPFDRLIGEVNRLIKEDLIREEVFMQVGYRYNITPICKHVDFLSMIEMDNYMNKASIVVVHGGLGSIMQAFINKKIPIVVPRQMAFDEHVDNHQLLFSKRMEQEKKILLVVDIKELGYKISNYKSEIESMGVTGDPGKSIEKRSRDFAEKLDRICLELVKDKQ